MKPKWITCVLLLALAACAPAGSQEQVKIGIISYLSGSDYTTAGYAFLRGAEIATDEVNRNGGLLGKNVTLIVDDDPSADVEKAIAPARKQLDIDKVSASMIPGYGNAMAISGLFEQHKTPLFVLWDSNEELEEAGDYLFPIGPGVEEAGKKAAGFMLTQGIETVAIIKTNSAYSLDNARFFRMHYERMGGSILFDEGVEPQQIDRRATIAKAMSKNPQGLYAPIEYHHDTFFKQAEEMGVDVPIHAGNAVTEQTIRLAQGAMEGVYLGKGIVPDNDQARLLEEAYLAKYGSEPDQIYFNALGYDAVMIAAEAIRRAGTDDPASVAEAIYTIEDFPAASRDELTISNKGSAPLEESVFQVKNGSVVLVEA